MQRCVFDHQLKDYRLLFTMTTKCWTDAYRWSKDASNQVRIRAADNIYVVVRRHVGGHLNDARASSLIDKFLNFSFLTYDEYTHLTKNVCILREDESRPELYNCTCIANAKEFACKHSAGGEIIACLLMAIPTECLHVNSSALAIHVQLYSSGRLSSSRKMQTFLVR